MRLTRTGFIAVSVAGVLAPRTAAGAEPDAINLIHFPGAGNLPVWCALAKGFFAREKLAVGETPTPGSVYMFQHLSMGDFDVALTAIDNAIAYDEGQGEAPLQNPPDFVAFMGGDSGFLRLYARPGVTGYADLRGKTMAVDALTTGYAFVLRRMLEVNGLNEGDYTLAPAGGTAQRYQKLTGGDEYAATLLTPPFDLQARARGFVFLGNAVDVVGRYQGICGVARRSWIDRNPDVMVRFIRAYRRALGWLYDAANRDEVVRLIVDNTGLSAELAASLYPILIDRQSGIAPGAQIDVAGVRTVLALRSRYGLPRKTLSDPGRYIDERYLRRAR